MTTLKDNVKYLDDLLFSDGINKLKNSFLGNKELLENGYDYHKEQDNYVKFDLVEFENSESPEMIATIITRSDFYELYLKQNQNSLYEYLRKREENNTFSDDLNALYNYLNSYIKKAPLLDVLFKDIINVYLTQIVQDLKIKYPIVENHRVFSILIQRNSSLSYFQDKDMKKPFFEALHEVAYNLDLIDDVEVSEDVFYEVFTSSAPKPDLKITFIAKNHTRPKNELVVLEFFKENNWPAIEGKKFYAYYETKNWKLSRGLNIQNWKESAKNFVEKGFIIKAKYTSPSSDYVDNLRKYDNSDKDYEIPL